MNRVIILLSVVAAIFVGAGIKGYTTLVPQPVYNSVIAEKPTKQIGNQAAVLLPAKMTEKQHRLINLAHEIAVQNGFKNPEIIQAIMLQESLAGGISSYRVANPGPQAYFGPMQIKLAAAKDVLNRWPQLFTMYGFHTRTDDEIKANLILNERFNIDVATRYVIILKNQYGFRGRQLLNAYNRGPGGVHSVDENFHYAIGAERKLAQIKN